MTRRTALSAAALAAAALASLVASAGAGSAAAVDPAAYGLAATGPQVLAAQPTVEWTAGAPLAARSTAVTGGPISSGPLAVASGDGFAFAEVTRLSAYGVLDVRALAATCLDGQVSAVIVGSADGRALPSAGRVDLPGGYAQIGAIATNIDGSTTVTGLTLVLGAEKLTAAVARCGPAS